MYISNTRFDKTKIFIIMKTQLIGARKLWFATILMIVATAFNPMYGQSGKATSTQVSQSGKIIKGVISDEKGPLENVNVRLKGTNTGTATNAKGEFTFPKSLKTGDILLITYIGYDTTEVRIKANTTLIKLRLSESVIEFLGSVNSNKRYKSKRTN
jgi:hypothetical protein